MGKPNTIIIYSTNMYIPAMNYVYKLKGKRTIIWEEYKMTAKLSTNWNIIYREK